MIFPMKQVTGKLARLGKGDHFLGLMLVTISGSQSGAVLSPQEGMWKCVMSCVGKLAFRNICVYLFLAALGLCCCCTRAFSSRGEQGLLSIEVCRLPLQWRLLLQSTGARENTQ